MYKYQCTIFLALICLGVFHCKSNGLFSPLDTFVIKVDSLQVADAITLNDTLVCKFWGTIGPSSCYQFQGFGVDETLQQIDFTLWGHNSNGDICADVMMELRGEEYRYIPGTRGTLRIIVHQPDNSTLRDSVLVK